MPRLAPTPRHLHHATRYSILISFQNDDLSYTSLRFIIFKWHNSSQLIINSFLLFYFLSFLNEGQAPVKHWWTRCVCAVSDELIKWCCTTTDSARREWTCSNVPIDCNSSCTAAVQEEEEQAVARQRFAAKSLKCFTRSSKALSWGQRSANNSLKTGAGIARPLAKASAKLSPEVRPSVSFLFFLSFFQRFDNSLICRD